MYPDEHTCKLIDEMLQNGTTLGTELSDALEWDHGIRVEPHSSRSINSWR
jgi:hypothetical protein